MARLRGALAVNATLSEAEPTPEIPEGGE